MKTLFEIRLNAGDGQPDTAIFLNAENVGAAQAAALEIMVKPAGDCGYRVTAARAVEFAIVADVHDVMVGLEK
jgi:hypothetical protein